MKKRNLLLVMLAILLAFGFMGCPVEDDPGDGDGDDDDVVDTSVVPNEVRGIYSFKRSTGITETIQFGGNTFNISDDSKTGTTPNNDFLNFTITKWEDTEVPADKATAYPNGYKFTGKILKQKGYVPSTYTVPGGVATDVKEDGSGPDFIMYLYFNADEDDATDITFIRTSFSKDGSKKDIVDTDEDRVYKKKTN